MKDQGTNAITGPTGPHFLTIVETVNRVTDSYINVT